MERNNQRRIILGGRQVGKTDTIIENIALNIQNPSVPIVYVNRYHQESDRVKHRLYELIDNNELVDKFVEFKTFIEFRKRGWISGKKFNLYLDDIELRYNMDEYLDIFEHCIYNTKDFIATGYYTNSLEINKVFTNKNYNNDKYESLSFFIKLLMRYNFDIYYRKGETNSFLPQFMERRTSLYPFHINSKNINYYVKFKSV